MHMMLILLEIEMQVLVNCHVWVLGTELRSGARLVCALHPPKVILRAITTGSRGVGQGMWQPSAQDVSNPLLFSGAVQARGKKRPAPAQNSDGDEEEESEEEAVANQGDLWGSEDSDADMVDDYGADSGSEDEEGKVRITSVCSQIFLFV